LSNLPLKTYDFSRENKDKLFLENFEKVGLK